MGEAVGQIARARETGHRGGWSLDLRTADPVTERTWDLRDPKQVNRVKWMMRRDRPRVLTLSPPVANKRLGGYIVVGTTPHPSAVLPSHD